jgi:hypothetical protein
VELRPLCSIPRPLVSLLSSSLLLLSTSFVRVTKRFVGGWGLWGPSPPSLYSISCLASLQIVRISENGGSDSDDDLRFGWSFYYLYPSGTNVLAAKKNARNLCTTQIENDTSATTSAAFTKYPHVLAPW